MLEANLWLASKLSDACDKSVSKLSGIESFVSVLSKLISKIN